MTDAERTEARREQMRASKRASRALLGRRPYDRHKTLNSRHSKMIQKARQRARSRGMDATITRYDIEWPEFCPVLGVRLVYDGGGGVVGPNTASLDRHDNTLGYIPGNVYVISRRANTLKNDATAEELEAVVRYCCFGVDQPPEGLEDVW